MPTMEAVVDRGESPQLRIAGAGNGGEAIRVGVEPLRKRYHQGLQEVIGQTRPDWEVNLLRCASIYHKCSKICQI